MDTARTYPSVPKVLLEVIQNGIDSGANRIEVEVNQQRRSFGVRDNGSGCGVEKFQKALRNLGSTMKGKDKYGRFGRGLVAPLSVAEEGFTFTSCEKPSTSPYYTYTFNPKAIISQAVVKIGGEESSNLKFNPDGKVWWRTLVEAKKLTRDRRLSSLTIKSLIDEILTKFSEAILSRFILISVKVTDSEGDVKSENVVASEYTGEKLPPFEANDEETGNISIELYVSKFTRGGRKGKVVFGTTDNPSRISIAEFIDNTRGGMLQAEVGRALNSGIFEGKILCEKVELNPDRTRFEDTEALTGFCLAIEDWWTKQGKAIVTELREKDDESRFQKLGESVMPYAELLLRQERYKAVVDSIEIGTTGRGHAKLSSRKLIGDDVGTSIASGSNTFSGKVGEGDGGSKGPRKENGKENSGHRPGIVYGPHGQRRKEVKGSSTGLRISFVEMENINIPFTFDSVTGNLTFNLDHPNWAACEETDDTLMKYEIAVITLALSLELFNTGPEGPSEEVLEFAFLSLKEQVFAITNSESMLKK